MVQSAPFAPAQASLFRRLQAARTSIRAALDEFNPDIVASHFAMYSAPGMDLLKDTWNISHFHGPGRRNHRKKAKETPRLLSNHIWKEQSTDALIESSFCLMRLQIWSPPDTVSILTG